jgi:GTP-binding protein HflX
LKDLGVKDKPVYLVFNKIDAYKHVEQSEFDFEEEKAENISIERLQKMWMAKENTHCIFISAKEKINIEKLRSDLYSMVTEIHNGRYPFNNLLY